MDEKRFEGMGLTDEARAKAMAATSAEELLALAREEGYELTDEELEAVSGGGAWDGRPCANNIGDERTDIDESLVSEAFKAGACLGDDA